MKKLIITILMVFTIIPNSYAALDDELEEMFGSMTNITGGNEYKSAAGGIYTGGSLVIKNKISGVNLLNFDPPNIDAGCGGIDMFAGSFSFINSEQLTALFQNIASNAQGYLFNLALNAMCPSCGQIMGEMQKIVQNINKLTKNSCTAATALVDATGSALGLSNGLEENGATAGTAKGIFDDAAAPLLDWLEGKSAWTKSLVDETLTGNITWKNAKDVANSGGTAGNKRQLESELTSLLPQVIVQKPTDDKKPLSITIKPPSVSVKDILFGATTGNNNSKIEIWNCGSDSECINPKKQIIDHEPLTTHLRKALIGDDKTDGFVRLLMQDLQQEGSVSMSGSVRQVVNWAAQSGHSARIATLARKGGFAAEIYTDQLIDVLAVEILQSMLDEMITSIIANIENEKDPTVSFALKRLREQRKEIFDYLKDIRIQSTNAYTDLASLYDSLMKWANTNKNT